MTMTKEIGGPSGGGDGDGNDGVDGGGPRIGRTPAFLTKTFLMVDDPNTNSVISWGKFGDSFIIWDHLKFSSEIMSKYFRHNNFASFVYQLNNYGFRKIGVEHQWEYRNPDFQAGKQHLLTKMKRRSSQNLSTRRRKTSLSPETMRDAINESKLEIEKLKMQQVDIDYDIAALQKLARNVESTSKKLMVYWVKACDIIAKRERKSCDDDVDDGESDDAKRKKLVEAAEIKTGDNEMNPIDVDEMVKENGAPLSENRSPSSSINNLDDHHVGKSKPVTIVGNLSNDLESWKNILLQDDEVFEVEVGSEMAKQHDKITQEMIMELADRNCSFKMEIEGKDIV